MSADKKTTVDRKHTEIQNSSKVNRDTQLNYRDFVKSKYKDTIQYSSTVTDLDSVSEENENLPCVGEFMNILYQKQLFTDVTFFPSKGKKSISAHRAVLAAKCPLFEELLFGSRKTEAIGMEMRMKISNLSFDVFCNIIKYFYTDEIDFTDDSTVMEILTGAKQFQIQSLIERCEIYIESIDLTADNVCSTLQISEAKNMIPLKQRCIQYIEENTDKVINSVDFDKSAYNTVHKICNLQSFNLSNEVQLLAAIVRWINPQPTHAQSQLKTPLLACVRFLTLTAGDFSQAMKEYEDFLDAKDALKILMFLNGTTTKDQDTDCLPKWCNRSIIQRCSVERIGRRERFKLRNRKRTISISLKPANEADEVAVAELKLMSYLQMTCIQGAHQINAIKFSFQGPPFNKSDQEKVTINVTVRPSNLSFHKVINVCSHEKKFRFYPQIPVKEGSIIKFQAVTKCMKNFRFLQFDEDNAPHNQHFQCTVASLPKQNRLFFISEVEYQPEQ